MLGRPLAVLITATLAASVAHAADDAGDLVRHEELGVSVLSPADWTVLVQPEQHNVVISQGLTNQIYVKWFDHRPGATLDIVLDLAVDALRKSLRFGEVTEHGRELVPGLDVLWMPRRAKRLDSEVSALGMTMPVAGLAMVDEHNGRLLAAFAFAPPDIFESADLTETLSTIVQDLSLDGDAKAPHPAWWAYTWVPPKLDPTHEDPAAPSTPVTTTDGDGPAPSDAQPAANPDLATDDALDAAL